MTGAQPKKSDLGVRVASAVVMVAVAGTALWLGGWLLSLFVVIAGMVLLFEWWGLVKQFQTGVASQVAWMLFGLIYVGTGAYLLPILTAEYAYGSAPGFDFPESVSAIIVFGVIATDVGAYFAGRTIGGPKIAPRISPSKTWSGLIGGALAAGLVLALLDYNHTLHREELFGGEWQVDWVDSLAAGFLIAMVAQAGDFFESWMKRRAGVKDSGKIIPGHGGLLDRVDGHLAVLFVLGSMILVGRIVS